VKPSWRFLQLADAAFPTGGFAHSGGLESALQAGEVGDAAALSRFAGQSLWQAGHFALPLIRSAHDDPHRLAELDARADTFLVNHVSNRQSRTQGRALLATAAAIFPNEVTPLREEARRAALLLHHAPLSGAIYTHLGLTLDESQRLFLFTTLRGVLSAAVRLGLIGTHHSQTLQSSLGPSLDDVLATCANLPLESLAQTAPIADLLAAAHDRLYSRMFQS